MRAHNTPDRFVMANSYPPLPPPEVVVFRRFPQLLSRRQIMLDSTSNNIGILMMLCVHIDYVTISDNLKCCSLLKDGYDSLRNHTSDLTLDWGPDTGLGSLSRVSVIESSSSDLPISYAAGTASDYYPGHVVVQLSDAPNDGIRPNEVDKVTFDPSSIVVVECNP